MSLEDDQKFALMKFRRNVKDVLQPHHDDQFLLRWLKARSWNAEAAEKMLRDSMEWRKKWNVDDIVETWTPPEVLIKYYVSGVSGYDKAKAPVYIIPIGPLDIVGLLHSVNRQDLIKVTIKFLEVTLDLAKNSGSHEVVAIFDLEDFTLKPWARRDAMELVISLLRMYEANYPEILKVCYIINAPKIFALAFSVIKKFINEYTISKIKIYKNDRRKWQKALLDHIDSDNLPKHYGGDMVDANGDPKCSLKIKYGGKVPKCYYKSNLVDEEDSKQRSTTINQGKSFSLDFMVNEEECYLKWNFRTDDHDIKFGVSYTDENGETHQAVQPHRISSNKLDVVGAVLCKAPATYTVTFDNSYSVLRGKKLYYSIYVTEPLSKLKINTLPETEDPKDV